MGFNLTSFGNFLNKKKASIIALTLVLFYLVVATSKVHPWITYLVIIFFSVIGLRYISPPPLRSIFNLKTTIVYAFFVLSIISAYYYQFVREISTEQNIYRVIVMQPIYVSLLIAPIVEELGYRRLPLSSLLNTHMHGLVACSISAILFALAHPVSNQASAFVTGYFLSYTYKITGNIWVSIGMHFLTNAIYFIDPNSFGATRVICDPCIRF